MDAFRNSMNPAHPPSPPAIDSSPQPFDRDSVAAGVSPSGIPGAGPWCMAPSPRSLTTRRHPIFSLLAALLAANPGLCFAQESPTVAPIAPTAAAPSPATITTARTTPTTAPSSLALEALLQRIQDLEQREAERAQAASNDPNASLVRTLQQRIVDLETKIQSLERSVVVPELIATPDPAPSNAELDQKIQVVDRKRELAEEQAAARIREMPQLSIGSTGFVMRSADTNFVLRIRGLIQADSRTFFDDNPLDDDNSGFLLRRARVGLEGTVFGDFDYQFNAELGDGGLGASNLQVPTARFPPTWPDCPTR